MSHFNVALTSNDMNSSSYKTLPISRRHAEEISCKVTAIPCANIKLWHGVEPAGNLPCRLRVQAYFPRPICLIAGCPLCGSKFPTAGRQCPKIGKRIIHGQKFRDYVLRDMLRPDDPRRVATADERSKESELQTVSAKGEA